MLLFPVTMPFGIILERSKTCLVRTYACFSPRIAIDLAFDKFEGLPNVIHPPIKPVIFAQRVQ
jgi:hypothetical protein